ncbi:hypothetical protein P7C70_g8589, partial [Phenoliferia sp. Uapishka_3]
MNERSALRTRYLGSQSDASEDEVRDSKLRRETLLPHASAPTTLIPPSQPSKFTMLSIASHRPQKRRPGQKLSGICPGMRLVVNVPNPSTYNEAINTSHGLFQHALTDAAPGFAAAGMKPYTADSFLFEPFESYDFPRSIAASLIRDPENPLDNDEQRLVYDTVVSHYRQHHPTTFPPRSQP